METNRPRLSPDVELIGPYRDSGLENPPYLVRRGDTVLQLSRLLLVVAAGVDGRRDFDEIAAAASAQLGRHLSADDVRYLIEEKLAPTGIVTPDGRVNAPLPPPATDHRLLALRFRWALVQPELVDDAARRLSWLFRPLVVTGILAVVLAFDGWLFAFHGVQAALDEVIRQPGLLAFVLVLGYLSLVFHEFGHAAGCRYSGARPGAVGAGIYLLWPVLYTNVTDSYRLSRAGRLRTDLGGIYFNAVFIAMLAGAYAATGFEPLVAAVMVEHFLILDQLMPWVRFDGYYVVTDLTGVPDILARVRPALQSLIPGRPRHPDISALRPGARRLLFAYLASLVIFVAVALVTVIVEGPELFVAGWESLPRHIEALQTAIGMWDLPMGIVVVIQIGSLIAPTVGLALVLGILVARIINRWARPANAAMESATRTATLRSG